MGSHCSIFEVYTPSEILLESALNGRIWQVQAILLEASRKNEEHRLSLVNAVDAMGWSSLHRASLMGHVDVIALLIEAGADIELTTKNGETALYIAADHLHTEACELLLRSGASPRLIPAEREGSRLIHLFLKPLVKKEGDKSKREGAGSIFEDEHSVANEKDIPPAVEGSKKSRSEKKAKKSVSYVNLNKLLDDQPVVLSSPSPQLTPRELELLPETDVVERKGSKMKEGSLSLKQVMDIVDATGDENTPVLPFPGEEHSMT
jgi:hypothetical protein